MNIEQTKEAIRVMQAYVDGKEVQCLAPNKEWIATDHPSWNFPSYTYRIKPTATLRPWTADEVPVGAQTRSKLKPSERFLITQSNLSLNLKQWLLGEYEHSTDGGVTWKPCGVVEESK